MSGFTVPARVRGALALGLALILVAPAARAEGIFFSLFDASPDRVAMQLERAGYQLRSALLRRGDVYICDVVDFRGQPQRLVLDIHDGRILQRFQARGPGYPGPRAYALRDNAPLDYGADGTRPLVDAPLLPPRSLPLDAAPSPDFRAASRGQPLIIDTPQPDANADKAKLKPKSHLAKPKPTPAPTPSSEANAAPTATQSTPSLVAPAAPATPAAPPVASPSPAAAAAPPAPVAEAQSAPPAAAAAPPPVKPAEVKPGRKPINDLPVDPLN